MRVKRVLLLVTSLGCAALLMKGYRLGTANAEVASTTASGFTFGLGAGKELRDELQNTKGEMDLLRAQYEEADRIIHYSSRFEIPANVASNVLEASMAEGIDPELAFRLVKLESGFNPRATSAVGAVGLTQLMVPTARFFQPNITREKLYDPKTNLRIGFRYLRALIKEYRGDQNIALLVYNRGEVAVKNALAAGVNPSNGYDRILTRNYRGKGVID